MEWKDCKVGKVRWLDFIYDEYSRLYITIMI